MPEKDPTLLKGEDFLIDGEYKSFTLEIENVETVSRQNESDTKQGLLIHFKGAKKPLFTPEDQMNYRMIRTEAGTVEPEKLVGKTLKLIPVKGNWFGEKNTLAIRVLVTGDKPKPKVSKKSFGVSVVGLKV